VADFEWLIRAKADQEIAGGAFSVTGRPKESKVTKSLFGSLGLGRGYKEI